MPHGHASFLGELVHHLPQLAAPFLGEGRQRDADEVAVVGGGETEVGREDGFFHGFEQRLVPRLHGEELRLGRRQSRGKSHPDRKSTRLNSSHTVISYAVFCLKKKNKKKNPQYHRTHANERS